MILTQPFCGNPNGFLPLSTFFADSTAYVAVVQSSRLPRTFLFDIPDIKARTSILQILLSNEPLSPEVQIATVAEITEGYSGSDLKEMCKCAALIPIVSQSYMFLWFDLL